CSRPSRGGVARRARGGLLRWPPQNLISRSVLCRGVSGKRRPTRLGRASAGAPIASPLGLLPPTSSLVGNSTMSPLLLADPATPSNFFKGARPTWHQRRRHRAVLDMLLGLEGEVLDFGCGYGDLTAAIARTHPVQGVDVDPERIAFAAREYSPLQFSVC